MEEPTNELFAPLIKEIYSDAVAPAMREFGKIGAQAVKVAHLALFPVQYGAVLQDRLARYLEAALGKVPEERRVAPRDAIMLPVAEKLRHQDESDNPIAALYVNLLARAMDRQCLGEAHPAFVHLIGQLAPDEVLILVQLNEQRHRIFFRVGPGSPALLYEELMPMLHQSPLGDAVVEDFLKAAVLPEDLAQPELFLTFVEHLVSLGIVQYTNEPRSKEAKVTSVSFLGFEYYYIKLTEFGQLFHRACIGHERKKNISG
jgi:hypothetical protein